MANLKREPRTDNKRERNAWRREVTAQQAGSGGTADRLVEYDVNLQLNPVDSLTKYIKGLENNIDVTDLGDGTVRITVSDLLSIVNLVLSGGLYFGDIDTNGSWRFIKSNDNLNAERRESGAWVKKGAFRP